MRTRPGPAAYALLLSGALVGGAAASAPAQAPGDHTPAGYEGIAQELRLGREALRSTLEDTLPEGVTLVELETGYLAAQGLLVIADLARPWYRRGTLDLDADLSGLEEIPDMVHEILRELDLGLSRQQVDELEELRGLRDAERAARAEQRAIRGQLRELGRRRLLAEGAEARTLEGEIDTLEAELADAAARERDLEHRAERRVSERPPGGTATPAPPPAAVDRAVAEALCRHGGAFGFAGDDEYANVVVRNGQESRYYVFTMTRVRACGTGDIEPQTLLERSLHYGG